MISIWISLATLLALAVVFIAWPLWRYKNASVVTIDSGEDTNARLADNVQIFREHLADLESSLKLGKIDTQQFAQLKLELERNLLDDEASLRALNKNSSQRLGRKVVIIFCILILMGGIFFYQKRGSATDVYIQSLQREKIQQDYQDMIQNRDPDPARAQKLVKEFEARLKDKPDNIQYWFLLARAQMEAGNFDEGAKAYQQVLTRDPQSPMIMAELAQAIFLRDGNQMTPPVIDLAKNSVALDPKNTMALGLLGISAFGQKDYKAAIQYWQKSADIAGADSQGGRALASGIEKAKQLFIAGGGKPEDLIAKSPYALTLTVSLGQKAKVSSDQTVFIYARAWKGSPMPLAITRIKVSDLPKTIQLDETMAMSPAASLANTSDVEVVARVSPSGSAKAEIGDWQAAQGPISMKSIPAKIELIINEQILTNN